MVNCQLQPSHTFKCTMGCGAAHLTECTTWNLQYMLTQSGAAMVSRVWQKKTLHPKSGLFLQVTFSTNQNQPQAFVRAQPTSCHSPVASICATLQHTMPTLPISNQSAILAGCQIQHPQAQGANNTENGHLTHLRLAPAQQQTSSP